MRSVIRRKLSPSVLVYAGLLWASVACTETQPGSTPIKVRGGSEASARHSILSSVPVSAETKEELSRIKTASGSVMKARLRCDGVSEVLENNATIDGELIQLAFSSSTSLNGKTCHSLIYLQLADGADASAWIQASPFIFDLEAKDREQILFASSKGTVQQNSINLKFLKAFREKAADAAGDSTGGSTSSGGTPGQGGSSNDFVTIEVEIGPFTAASDPMYLVCGDFDHFGPAEAQGGARTYRFSQIPANQSLSQCQLTVLDSSLTLFVSPVISFLPLDAQGVIKVNGVVQLSEAVDELPDDSLPGGSTGGGMDFSCAQDELVSIDELTGEISCTSASPLDPPNSSGTTVPGFSELIESLGDAPGSGSIKFEGLWGGTDFPKCDNSVTINENPLTVSIQNGTASPTVYNIADIEMLDPNSTAANEFEGEFSFKLSIAGSNSEYFHVVSINNVYYFAFKTVTYSTFKNVCQ